MHRPHMRQRLFEWLVGIALVVATFGLFVTVCEARSAYLTNDAFWACVHPGGVEPTPDERAELYAECYTLNCPVDWELPRTEMVGLFIQTRWRGSGEPSCVPPPGLADIFLP